MKAVPTPRPIDHPHAWRGADLDSALGRISLPGPAVDEVIAFARRHAELDLEAPGELDAPGEPGAPLDHLRAAMGEAARQIEAGRGFAVLDRIPMEALSVAEAKVAAWALFTCIGRVVDQKLTGSKVYDVIDKKVRLGRGVRRSITNLAQEFHTDAGWLRKPPEYVGLCCRERAQQGGSSQLLSLVKVYNELTEFPRHLQRLCEPFWWDRQAEHPPDDSSVSRQPVLYRERDQLRVRYYDDYIRQGQSLAGEEIDEDGVSALAAMTSIVDRPELQVEFALERGQFMILHNGRIAHSRSAFEDADPSRPARHYFRLWSRRGGAPTLEG